MRVIECLKLAIAVVWLLTELSANSVAQDQDIIRATIGSVDFQVPKEFVTHWNPGPRGPVRLEVEFGYPNAEPLGLLRFGRDASKWTSYQRSRVKEGLAILDVELRPGTTRDSIEIGEVMRVGNRICESVGGKTETYAAFNVDFTKCLHGKEFVLTGHSQKHDIRFRYQRNSETWSLSNFDAKNRIWTSVRIIDDYLGQWEVISDHARATVDRWKN
jgi:hypothetical protein